MRRAYQVLLVLYPWDFRAAFAEEMRTAFDHALLERACPIRFALKELAGLAGGAGREWIAKLATNPIDRGRALPDVRMMRPPGIPREIWFAPPGKR